ncbi:MAG: IS630 transposase-related protein [Chloroflexota bacterium]
MKSYSLDLRERIVASRHKGKSVKWIVETFQVSISSVKRYIRQAALTGNVARLNQRRKQPQIRGTYETQLAGQVARMADATLEAHIEEWERTTGMHVSRATMCRALQRIRQTRKKDNRGSGAG